MDWLAAVANSENSENSELDGKEDTMEINLIEEARKLISSWEKERKTAEYNHAFYSGAIHGINLYISNLGDGDSGGHSEPPGESSQPEG